MRVILPAIASSILALSVCGSARANSEHAPASAQPASSSKLSATQAAMRDLWVGHIFWVREVVRNMADKDDAATKVAEGRVVQNAKQIAGAIEPFYGKAASDALFDLLAGHYTAVKSHATATLAGDAAAAKAAFEQLVANADGISAFLSKANPHLPQNTLRSLLVAHGGHHVQQNQQIAKGDAAAEAETWEQMLEHIYGISDALVGALAAQFPAKF